MGLRDEGLIAWDGWEPFVTALADHVGIKAPLGERFACVLPGHDRTQPAANLWRDERGLWVYACHHFGLRLALGQLYASFVAGDLCQPIGPELTRWKQRCIAELGFIELPEVELPRPSDNAPDAAWFVYPAVLVHFRVRAIEDRPGEPVTCSKRFLARWGNVSEGIAQAGLRALEQDGVIERAGSYPSGYGRPSTLWRPGRRS